MTFETEEDLKEVALKAFENELLEGPYSRIDEFDYANGRTDVVYAKESEAYLERRFNELGISSSIDGKDQLITFLQLHGRGTITRDHFFGLGAMDKSSKKRALKQLIKDGFVVETGDNKIRTAPNLRRHIVSSFAIELKLTKWKTALKQAIRGKSYAEYQFVALPENSIISAQENIELFKQHNVGLIEVFEEPSYYIHHYPEKANPYSPTNKWRLNERTIIEGREMPG